MATLLIAYALWPMAHRQLVERMRTNPWKLAGWAMYTTAAPRGRISAVGIDRKGTHHPLALAEPAALSLARSDYLGRRISLGLFADPQPLAEALAQAAPRFVAWHLIVEEVGLSGRAYLEPVYRSTYSYRRGGTGLELAHETHEPLVTAAKRSMNSTLPGSPARR